MLATFTQSGPEELKITIELGAVEAILASPKGCTLVTSNDTYGIKEHYNYALGQWRIHHADNPN